MREKDMNDGGNASDKSGRFLKNAMEENALKLQELSHSQAQKIAELSKVQQELEVLNRLYPGNIRQK